MDLAYSFLNFIKDVKPITIILVFFGLVLFWASFVKSSYGVLSFTGALSIVAAIVLRVLETGSIADVFIMLFIILFSIFIIFMLSVKFSKYGWIIRMPVSKVSDGVKEIDLSNKKE